MPASAAAPDPFEKERERVIAGTDCGFATFAGRAVVDPDIAWAKLAALSAGARLASQRLRAAG